jgi:presenilin-like A22 family membrane protease
MVSLMSSDESEFNSDNDEKSGTTHSSSSDQEKRNPSSFLPVYRVRMKFHTIPLLVAIILSGLIAWYISVSMGFETVIPEENAGQGLINGLIYTAFAVVSSIIIFLLVKKKGQNILKVIMSIAFLFLTFTLVLFFGMLIIPFNSTNQLIFNIEYYSYMGFSVVIAVLLTYLYFSDKMPRIPKNLYVLFIGTFIGAFMAIAMPMWTMIVLLVGVSIWDIISVKKGPIKGIMEIMGHVDPDEVRNLTKEDFDQAEIQIGIGDIAFYSMLTSGTLVSANTSIVSGIQLEFYGSVLVTIITAIGILVGAFITIRALRKNAILPGLPLSILIGLVFAVVSYIILINIRFFWFYVP